METENKTSSAASQIAGAVAGATIAVTGLYIAVRVKRNQRAKKNAEPIDHNVHILGLKLK